MKRFLLLMTGFCMVALAACAPNASTPSPAPRGGLEKIQKTGILRVGYFPFEPAAILDPGAQKPRGFFVDLVEDIAREMRWKVEYVQVDLKNFAAGLASGDFDLSIGATFSSPSRAGGVLFSRPLFYLGYTGVSTAANATRFKTWADVDQKGVRVAVKQGSAIADYARVHFKNATIVSLEAPNLNAPLAAVPGQADIGLMNQVTVFTYLRDNKDKTSPTAGATRIVEVLSDQPKEFTGICWAVRPDDIRFLEFINSSIKHEIDTGRYDEYIAPYDIPNLYRERETYSFKTKSFSGQISR